MSSSTLATSPAAPAAPAPVGVVNIASLNAREIELVVLAMQCFKGDPKIDHAKLAHAAGMPTPKRAMDAMFRIRRKLNLVGGPKDGTESPKASPAKKSPAKRAKESPSQEESSPTKMPPKESPSKKRKKNTEADTGGTANADNGNGNDDMIAVKPEAQDAIRVTTTTPDAADNNGNVSPSDVLAGIDGLSDVDMTEPPEKTLVKTEENGSGADSTIVVNTGGI